MKKEEVSVEKILSLEENGFDLKEILKELKKETKKRGMDCEKSNDMKVMQKQMTEDLKEGLMEEIREVLGKEEEKNIRKIWSIDGPMRWEEILVIKMHLRIFKFQKEKEIK